ncbi:MAG TPA: CHASE2 domain-containing protein, partial [Candidatus Xenobia bacterium]
MNAKALLVGLVAGCLVCALHDTRAMHWLERKSLDFRFCAREWTRQTVPVSPDIAVILIDDDTYADDAMRQVPSVLWLPWYAELTGGLLDAGARVVGIDAVLSRFDDAYYRIGYPKLDNALTPLNDAVQRAGAGHVMLGAAADFPEEGKPRIVLPTADLALVVGYDAVGHLNLTGDYDDVKRFQWLPPVPIGQADVMADSNKATWPLPAIPGFAPLLASPKTTAGVPMFHGGYAYINYAGSNIPYRPAGPFPSWSMVDVLGMIHRHETDKLHAAFAGKTVLVGSGTSDDLHLTPFNLVSHKEMAGVAIHAHVINMLLTGRNLVPISWQASTLLTLL